MKTLKIVVVASLALAATACSKPGPHGDWLSQAPNFVSPSKS
jgi:hypothetical protein